MEYGFKQIGPNVEYEVKEKTYEYRGVVLKAAYPHIEPYLEAVNNSAKYRFWVDQFEEQGTVDLREFTLTDMPNFFGPPVPEKLGFFKGYGKAYEAGTDIIIPSNIVFGRGECDACLVIATVTLHDHNGTKTTKRLIPLAEQVRFASGGYRIEALAGMRDARTRAFKGPIITEIEEEFGIKITEDDPRLNRLPGEKAWPSPGGCDEAIYHWYFEFEIDEAKYWEMKERIYGENGNEKIRIRFFEFNDKIDEVLNEIGDYKVSDMVRRYRYMKETEYRFVSEIMAVESETADYVVEDYDSNSSEEALKKRRRRNRSM
jgi:hypothetical protein